MKKLLAAIVIGVLIPCFASAAVLPWKTFSEQAKDATGSSFAGCATSTGIKEVFRASFRKDGNGYMTYFGVDTRRYVVMVYPNVTEGALPSEVGIGVVDPEQHDTIPALSWKPYETGAIDVCSQLFPETA